MAWWQRKFGRSTSGRIVALLRRGEYSVEELAHALHLTDNAVRAQLSSLEHDGIVEQTRVRRDGAVGKPATLYALSAGAGPVLSSAYAPLLASLLAELGGRVSGKQLTMALRGAGVRLAPSVPPGTPLGERVSAAAALLSELGADADVVTSKNGYEIRGHGCVLSEAVSTCPATCQAVEALLSEATGVAVKERCDRTNGPNCRFLIPQGI